MMMMIVKVKFKERENICYTKSRSDDWCNNFKCCNKNATHSKKYQNRSHIVDWIILQEF